MNYAPIARIILRYLVGGVFMGSAAIGSQLAADPDIVAVAALAVAAVVEVAYTIAKRKGLAT